MSGWDQENDLDDREIRVNWTVIIVMFAVIVGIMFIGERARGAATIDQIAWRLHNAEQVTDTIPPSFTPTWYRCTEYEQLAGEWGLPDHFQNVMWRESRCKPTARNWCCTGLVQIHKLWVPNLGHCDVNTREDLVVPWKNLCAAAHVLKVQGPNAWVTW